MRLADKVVETSIPARAMVETSKASITTLTIWLMDNHNMAIKVMTTRAILTLNKITDKEAMDKTTMRTMEAEQG